MRAKISVGLKYDILFYAMGLVESFRHPFLYAMPNPYEGVYAAVRPCNGKERHSVAGCPRSHTGSCSLEGPQL
jgi:hypothetical protein